MINNRTIDKAECALDELYGFVEGFYGEECYKSYMKSVDVLQLFISKVRKEKYEAKGNRNRNKLVEKS